MCLPIAVPQGRVSEDGPEHGAPQELPRVHDRDLVCDPIPHFTEHALQAPYPPHLELTERKTSTEFRITN